MPKSNKRFVAMIMSVMVLLIGGILLIVYITTSVQTKKENKEMLQVFADSYDENGFPNQMNFEVPEELDEAPDFAEAPAEAPAEPSAESHLYEISTFFAVAFDTDGNVKEYFNDSSSPFSDEELVEYASNLLDQKDTFYQGKSVVALITYGEDYILVSMMDTAATDSTITHLVVNMIIYGIVAVVVVFFLSFFLAKWVMRPAEMGYEKQKQFISDAGHELKTPISAIGANIEVLKKEIGENRWLDNISYENDRMLTLVCQLLDLAKIESKTSEVYEVNLSLLCEEVLLPFEAFAYERNVEFSYDVGENIFVRGNEDSLKKMLDVLIENGISHSITPGEVRLSLEKKNDKVLLSVSNSGAPLSETEINHMFDRFYKSDASRCEDKGHYGLGLAIAKAAADEMGANIRIECFDEKVYFKVEIPN